MTATTDESLSAWAEADESLPRCKLKPEHVRPFLRALRKQYPRVDFCNRQRAAVSRCLDDAGLPPYDLLKAQGDI